MPKHTFTLMLCALSLLSWGCLLSSDESADYDIDVDDSAFISGTPRPQALQAYQRTDAAIVPMGASDLALLQDNATVLATDTSTNALYFVNIKQGQKTGTIDFGQGAHPSRISLSQKHGYVILRGTGEIVRVDTNERAITQRAKVCSAPRGVAHDGERNRVWVSCASGQLLALDPNTLETLSTTHLDADLRDVVSVPNGILVSRFRSAEVISIDPSTGKEIERTKLESDPGTTSNTLWRLRATPSGSIAAAYQESTDRNLSIPDASAVVYYGPAVTGGCGSVVSSMSAIINVQPNGAIKLPEPPVCHPETALPTDITVTNNDCNDRIIFQGASFADNENTERSLIHFGRGSYSCTQNFHNNPTINQLDNVEAGLLTPEGDIISLTRSTSLQIHVHAILGERRVVKLRQSIPTHLGNALFHMNSGRGIACASCHAEGGDDGHIWKFERTDNTFTPYEQFTRRTQNLRGGIQGKLHWDGEFEDIDELMANVFTSRMGGFNLNKEDGEAIQDWLNRLAPQKGMTLDPHEQLAADRGKALYEDQQVGCANCHGGEKLTDYKLYDVGTGGMFKTPTLRGISQRHQLMHDGCAKTLRDRFEPGCGGDKHGDLSGLTSEDLDDLTSYLKIL